MKILQLHQIYFSMLGISLHQSQQKYPFNWRNVWTISMLSLAVISSSIQFFYVAESFNEYTNALYSASGMTAATINFAIVLHKMRPLADCLNHLEVVVNERLKNQALRSTFEETNLQVEKLCKIVISVTMTVLYPSVMFSKFLISFFAYFVMDLGNDAFELPFPYWFPFDWKNPRGYLMAFILQFTMLIGLYFFVACAVSFGIGIYTFTVLLIDDIKNNFNSINESLPVRRRRRNANSTRNPQINLLKLLADTVRLHSIVKQIFRDISQITKPLFLVVFSWSLLTICGSMLIMNAEIANGINLVELIIPIVELFVSFVLVLVSCELAGRLTNEFNGINDLLNQFNWYLFPLDVQNLLPIIMANTQQSVYLECFGRIPCDRETFKKVTNTGFSYFMVLREF